MKQINIADFREKIILLATQTTVDEELNRVETLVPTAEVWANITIKSGNFDNTEAGTKPQLRYVIYIRKQPIQCEYVRYNGKLLILTSPFYVVDNKYICIEAVAVV